MSIPSITSSTAVAPDRLSTISQPDVSTQEVVEQHSTRPSTIVTLSSDAASFSKADSADPEVRSSSISQEAAAPKDDSKVLDKSSLVDETKFPGLAAYARGEKGITLTEAEGAEALRLGIMSVGKDKSSMPLSEAWAPQLFVQAGGAGGKLNLDQFTKQLGLAGIDSTNAKSMFKDFDKSGDGSLSVDEYYDGIKSGGKKSTDIFQSLIDVYTRNPDGTANDHALNLFLAQGAAMAISFWSRRD